MSDWFFKRGGTNRLFNWLAIDAWLDSSLNDVWLHDQGPVGGSDGLSPGGSDSQDFGAGQTNWPPKPLRWAPSAFLVMLFLAIPAFQAVDRDDWLATGEYSVTLLDRNGEEIGKARYSPFRCGAARRDPGLYDQGNACHGG